MKRKDRRQREREAEQIRREASMFPIALPKLLAIDAFRAEVFKAAEIAEKEARRDCDEHSSGNQHT